AIEISAFDEGYRTPSADAHLVGLRTQQILDLETDVAEVLDPLGGSYYVEHLTLHVEEEILATLPRFEAPGDPGEACERGVFAAFPGRAMPGRQRALATGALRQVGVNVHRPPPEEAGLLREEAEDKIPPYVAHAERTAARRRARDIAAVRRGLDALSAVAAD